ncbi:POU domain; class 4; transcription factor 1 [Camelus dromedarius]|uniref:POU domain n=1 Tax=Camelus dromedarius TaxID=9838 RepID=A0A5N4D9Y2_CAMDR|nr:POU domain; class 4; transcription factor 1 [Camelus dromedarius]
MLAVIITPGKRCGWWRRRPTTAAAAQRRPAAAGQVAARRRRRAAVVGAAGLASICDSDTDPRELEAFAERFKQRRIKLGVTQADVGSALATSRSRAWLAQQSTIAGSNRSRFANNMIALKPILRRG